jgi:hypothetical protein
VEQNIVGRDAEVWIGMDCCSALRRDSSRRENDEPWQDAMVDVTGSTFALSSNFLSDVLLVSFKDTLNMPSLFNLIQKHCSPQMLHSFDISVKSLRLSG